MGERGIVCTGCGERGSVWCKKCQERVVKIVPPYCRRCGYPSHTTLCKNCRYHEPWFDQARSWARYGGELRNAILALKREENQRLTQVFAKELLSVLWFMSWEIDFIVPVPLSAHKYEIRGFNQAESLAKELATLAGINFRPNFLARQGREHKNAFQSSPKTGANDVRILLIDDVYTTGATANAASRVLKRSGARQVFVLTIARSLVNTRM